MSTVKDPFKDLDLTGQDLGPIEASDEEYDLEKYLESQPFIPDTTPIPGHMMRRSLKTEEDLWTQIVNDPRDEIWYKIGASRTAAATKRTRFYHARSFIMASARRNNYLEVSKVYEKYSILLRKHKENYYLIFLNLDLNDELLDRPEDA